MVKELQHSLVKPGIIGKVEEGENGEPNVVLWLRELLAFILAHA